MDIIAELNELEKHYVYVNSELESLGSDEWEFIFIIKYLPLTAQNLKRRGTSIVTYSSFKGAGSSYSGTFEDQESALEAGIQYAKSKILPLCMEENSKP